MENSEQQDKRMKPCKQQEEIQKKQLQHHDQEQQHENSNEPQNYQDETIETTKLRMNFTNDENNIISSTLYKEQETVPLEKETNIYNSQKNLDVSYKEFKESLVELEVLGKGAFGKVCKAFSQKTGKFYAIKSVTTDQYIKKLEYEIKIMKIVNEIQNSTLIKLISLEEISKNHNPLDQEPQIIMESGSCSLRDILNQGRTYTEPQIKGFLEEICISLNECQMKRIAHRDLKPENFILNEFNSKYILSDFGEAIILPESLNEINELCVGTVPYMCKEMFDQFQIYQQMKNRTSYFKYNPFAADISSLGLIILELMGVPFQLRNDIRNGKSINEIYKQKYPVLCPIVQKMMKINVKERPTYQEILDSIKTRVNGALNETQFAHEAKLSLYQKIDSKSKILDLIKLYSKIERSQENIILCEYCLTQFVQELTNQNLLFVHYKYGEALISTEAYDQAIQELNLSLQLIEKDQNPNCLKKNLKKMSKIYQQMALAYYYKEDKTQAKTCINKALEIIITIFGKNNQEYGSIKLVQAQLEYLGTEYNMAQNLLLEAMNSSSSINNGHNPILAKVYRYLAMSYIQQRNDSQAIKYLKEASKINKEKYHDQLNLEEIYIKLCFSEVYTVTENWDQIEKFLSESRQLIGKLLGNGNINEFLEKNKEASIITNNYQVKFIKEINKQIERADLLQQYGTQYQDALLSYQEIEPKVAKVYGKTSLKYAEILEKIGSSYDGNQDIEQAMVNYEKSLAIKKQIFGETHLEVINSYKNIGNMYRMQENFEEAVNCQEKALEISKQIFGNNNEYVADSYNNIGLIYDNQEEFSLAIEYYEKSLTISKELHGEIHEDVATFYYNIGMAYDADNNLPKAIEYYEKQLAINLQIFGENNQYASDSYNKIGMIYYDQGKFLLALKYQEKALQIQQQIFGDNHQDVAISLKNIGLIEKKQKNFSKSLEYFEKASRIQIKNFGENHQKIATYYYNIAELYFEQKIYDESLKYFKKSYEIDKKHFGSEDYYTLKDLQYIKEIESILASK